MAIWSSLKLLNKISFMPLVKRQMSGHGPPKMKIEVSRWQWHKFKDIVHYYIMVGAIPITAIMLYANVFIGPATLAEIPEGYTPKHWEYYQHPITRFIARYITISHQQEYEKYMHYLYEEDEKAKMRALTREIQDKMAEKHDYQAYYYRPVTAKYHRVTKEVTEQTKHILGDTE